MRVANHRKTEEFIRRNLAGQNTKQAQGRRKQLERLERADRPQDEFRAAGQIGLQFSIGDHAGGKEAIRTEGLSVGYAGADPLVRDLTLTIYRGERVGIVGPNGSGKSTLMKTLLDKLPAVSGTATLGHEVRVGYFDQKLSELDEDKSLIDEVRSIRGDFNEDVARAFLGRFRFSGDDPFRKVKGLSGGERNRLSLAKMMLRPRNLLALDEPTNHLDIPAREVLEDALVDYAGTVLVISHDRYFLDRIATKILQLHDGRATLHAGNYSDLHDRLAAQRVVIPVPEPKVAPATPVATGDKAARVREREAGKARDRELEKKKRQLAELESKISAAEQTIAQISAELVADHAGDWQRLHGLVADKERAEVQLAEQLAKWERLSADLEHNLQ